MGSKARKGPGRCVCTVLGCNKICKTGLLQPQIVTTPVSFHPNLPSAPSSLVVLKWLWAFGKSFNQRERYIHIYGGGGIHRCCLHSYLPYLSSPVIASGIAPSNTPPALCANLPDQVPATETQTSRCRQAPNLRRWWKRNTV